MLKFLNLPVPINVPALPQAIVVKGMPVLRAHGFIRVVAKALTELHVGKQARRWLTGTIAIAFYLHAYSTK